MGLGLRNTELWTLSTRDLSSGSSISSLYGLQVSQGQEVLILEAMKMQNSLTAGKSGKVGPNNPRFYFWLIVTADLPTVYLAKNVTLTLSSTTFTADKKMHRILIFFTIPGLWLILNMNTLQVKKLHVRSGDTVNEDDLLVEMEWPDCDRQIGNTLQ